MTELGNLEKLREKGIRIDWSTVFVGWDKSFFNIPLVTSKEVIRYASEIFALTPSRKCDALLSIVIATEDEESIIRESLRQLAHQDGSSKQFAQRKWRVMLLSELLPNIKSLGPTHGLIRLTEFWDDFGFPQDMPHVVQGRENTVKPDRYYSVENLKEILKRHNRWIQDELAHLSAQDIETSM
jgi:hypothetical protein